MKGPSLNPSKPAEPIAKAFRGRSAARPETIAGATPKSPCAGGQVLLHARHRSGLPPLAHTACGRGGIGRRAALRSLWGNPWKFESSRPHQPFFFKTLQIYGMRRRRVLPHRIAISMIVQQLTRSGSVVCCRLTVEPAIIYRMRCAGQPAANAVGSSQPCFTGATKPDPTHSAIGLQRPATAVRRCGSQVSLTNACPECAWTLASGGH